MNIYSKNASTGLILAFWLMSFQACSNVSLVERLGRGQSTENSFQAPLPAPVKAAPRLRVVIFVDQSYSMIQGKCQSDLDGSNPRPDNNVSGCIPDAGIDPEGNRYSAINEWIEELEEFPTSSSDDIKVALIPFSGGIKRRPRLGQMAEAPRLFKFRTLPQTKARLATLKSEQEREMAVSITEFPMSSSPAEAIYMGTTAPNSTLDYMLGVITEEMASLEKEELLETTPFRIIYISDGVFKPLKKHWDLVWNFSNCNQAQNRGFRLCYDLARDFKNNIGDVQANTFENTLATFNTMINFHKQFENAQLTLDFVKINPGRIPLDDLNGTSAGAQYRNLFDQIEQSLKDMNDKETENKIKIYSQFDEHRPFSIRSAAAVRNYKIANFYTINFNYHVNDLGQAVVDSDGDGLDDAQEISLGFDPQNMRSNNICLDIISHLYGCKVLGCNADLDVDGDGLNECEEITLSTDAENRDTDGDGILDSHELLRKLSPTINEVGRFSSSDAISDHDHFFKGASPYTDLRLISPDLLMNFSVNEAEYLATLDNLGQETLVKEYQIVIDNIPINLTLDLLPRSSDLQLLDRNLQPFEQAILPLGTAHEAGVNQILYVIKAQALQDPTDIYWLILHEDVHWPTNRFYQKLFLNFDNFKQLQ